MTILDSVLHSPLFFYPTIVFLFFVILLVSGQLVYHVCLWLVSLIEELRRRYAYYRFRKWLRRRNPIDAPRR